MKLIEKIKNFKAKSPVKLSDHFTYKRIFRFTVPSIIMMVFTSIYGVVDGLFVSNFVGKTAFSAVNFIMPFLMMLSCVGFMFGAGGSALISKTLGEGDNARANRQFSLFVLVNFLTGIVLSVLGFIFMESISSLLGATGQMLEDSVRYGRIIVLGLPAFVLQNSFQAFFVTAEKPKLGLLVTVLAGCTNIVLDGVLVGAVPLGIKGAAVATVISQCVGGFVPVIYFLTKNGSLLRIGKPVWDGKALLKTVTNGSSELLSNISMNLVGMLYNVQLLKYAGEDGVAAYGVLMYVTFVFISIFIGYSVGSAPIVGYHYGASNHMELKNLLKKSTIIMLVTASVMFALGEALASPIASLFVGYDEGLYALTKRAFNIYSFAYLTMGFGIFSSSFFTALNDGLISAIISFMRTLVFQVVAVFTLPLLLGVDGIWASIVIAELLSCALSVIFLFAKKNKYRYM